jgi:hypothetical protein
MTNKLQPLDINKIKEWLQLFFSNLLPPNSVNIFLRWSLKYPRLLHQISVWDHTLNVAALVTGAAVAWGPLKSAGARKLAASVVGWVVLAAVARRLLESAGASIFPYCGWVRWLALQTPVSYTLPVSRARPMDMGDAMLRADWLDGRSLGVKLLCGWFPQVFL